MSSKRTFGAASRSSPSLRWNSSRCSSGTRPTSRNDITWPSFIAAPFIVPSAVDDLLGGLEVAPLERPARRLLGAREVGRARAGLLDRLAGRQPARPARCGATREVGILSRAMHYDPRARAARSYWRALRPATPGTMSSRAVRPAHPGLVAAVVVVAEQNERRRLAERRAGLVALGVESAPDADERVALPLVGRPSSGRCGPGGRRSRAAAPSAGP